MIESELKYRVREPDSLLTLLAQYASPRLLTYNDQYYRHAALDLNAYDAELRIREISESDTVVATILTFKRDVADDASQSKTEYEVDVASSQDDLRKLFEAMAFECYIAFRKHCRHFRFLHEGRDLAVTVVNLDEVTETFVELEQLVATVSEVPAALEVLHAFARTMGLDAADRTVDTYEGTVAEARGLSL